MNEHDDDDDDPAAKRTKVDRSEHTTRSYIGDDNATTTSTGYRKYRQSTLFWCAILLVSQMVDLGPSYFIYDLPYFIYDRLWPCPESAFGLVPSLGVGVRSSGGVGRWPWSSSAPLLSRIADCRTRYNNRNHPNDFLEDMTGIVIVPPQQTAATRVAVRSPVAIWLSSNIRKWNRP